MANDRVTLEQQEQVLLANRDFIIKHLDSDDVIDELIQARLIGASAAQRLGLITMSRVDKNRVIYEQLYISGPGSLQTFCDILKKKKRQTFIAERLEKGVCSTITESDRRSSCDVNPCKIDVKRLKSRYLRLPPTAKTEWPKHKVTHFVRLAIIEKEDVTLRDENLNDITKLTLQGDVGQILKEKKPLDDLKDIFHYENKPCPRLIVIMGSPGIGKTTLANEICVRWARDGFLSEDFDVIILIPMRCIKQRSLEEMLIEYVEIEGYHYLRRLAGSRCLIILEGLDEMATDHHKNDQFFIRLIKECTVLEEATVMITSRPHSCNKLNADRQVEVIGFGINEIKEFIKRSFPNDERSVSELLQQIQDYPHLYSMCYVPLNLVMIVDIFKCNQKKLPSTLTELYKLFIVRTLQREIVKEDKKYALSCVATRAANSENLKKILPGIPKDTIGTVFLLCRLSYCGFFNWYTHTNINDNEKLKDPKIIFTMEDLVHCGINMTPNQFDGFGFLKATHIHELPTDTTTYNFSHLSIQEFLCSLYISLLSQKEQQHLMNEHFIDFPNVFNFLCGLTGLKYPGMYRIIYLKMMSLDYVVPAVRCMYESNRVLKSSIPFSLNISWNHLLPYDCCCLSSVLSNYPISELKMESCWIGDVGAEVLVKHCSDNNTTTQLLKMIDLRNNYLTAIGMAHVMKIVKTSTALRELIITRNDIGDDGISVITEGLYTNKLLIKLGVSYCNLSVRGASCLSELLKINETLQELYISGNDIGNDGMSLIADGLKCNKALVKLHMRKCGISVKGAVSISQTLLVNHTMLHLVMSGNDIGDEGIITIASTLRNSCITVLSVEECGITFAGVRSLATALLVNKSIRILALCDNSITINGAHLIMQSAVDNGVCQYVRINGEYWEDHEVKKMMTILYDRATEASNKNYIGDKNSSGEQLSERISKQQATTMNTQSRSNSADDQKCCKIS